MRYAVFFILALICHVLLLGPFWFRLDDRHSATGGGPGGFISVSVIPLSNNIGTKKTVSVPTPQTFHESYDLQTSKRTGSGEGESAGPATGDGSGAHGFDQILAQIRRRIEKAKYYPLIARRQGLEGVANVSFRIHENGQVKGLEIVQSSGSSFLDDAALKTVRRAAPFPFYAQPIRIGIRFALQKETE